MPGNHGVGCGCVDEDELKGGKFLLPYIDIDRVHALNEQDLNSVRNVFKPYRERLNGAFCSTAYEEPEMIIHIPFTSPCKLTGLHVIGGDDDMYPSTVRIFRDNEHLDLSVIRDTAEIQSINLAVDYHGAVEYPLKVSKLQNVTCLTLHFFNPQDVASKKFQIHYIGIRGEGSSLQRKAVSTVYEARANTSDHQALESYQPFVL